jgi:hypothetical protein
MRRLDLMLMLLAIAAPGLANATEYPNRLPHGSAVDAVPRIKRTDIETSPPVFALERADLAQQSDTPRTEAPPPPPLDDPAPAEPFDDSTPPDGDGDGDVVTLREAVPDATEKVLPEARAVEDPPLPEKVKPTAPDADVSIRREGPNVIEEYRRSGQVYMVVVTPDKGPKYTYLDTDADGRLEGDPREGRARPVYYTLYQWE